MESLPVPPAAQGLPLGAPASPILRASAEPHFLETLLDSKSKVTRAPPREHRPHRFLPTILSAAQETRALQWLPTPATVRGPKQMRRREQVMSGDVRCRGRVSPDCAGRGQRAVLGCSALRGWLTGWVVTYRQPFMAHTGGWAQVIPSSAISAKTRLRAFLGRPGGSID